MELFHGAEQPEGGDLVRVMEQKSQRILSWEDVRSQRQN